MKHILYLLIIVLAVSCKKDSVPYGSEFEKSNRTWLNYKADIHNSYSYITYYGSVFGSYAETKLTVQNGKVVGRMYTYTSPRAGTTNVPVIITWTEDSATLNTHKNEGAATITLDDIYAQAKTDYLTVDANKNDIYFRADANGLIASCGYVPKGCQDDCFIGVNIKSITQL